MVKREAGGIARERAGEREGKRERERETARERERDSEREREREPLLRGQKILAGICSEFCQSKESLFF